MGRHFIVGYARVDEVAPLAAQGLIAGLYVTRRNAATPRRDIALLQELRRANRLPPLLVATDQEGGIVSDLSPPLPAMPPLADLANLSPGDRADAARRYGVVQGRGLASLGVTVDFSPVVDLKRSRLQWDRNSLISQRAIAADPAVVGDIAAAYAAGLASAGVIPTVKHFPGLGRVRADTHHIRTRLDTPVEELEASDWRPFRRVLAGNRAILMVGHVILGAVDPERPASHSPKVIDGIIRRRWGFGGVIVTDDLTMPTVLHHGFCTAVVEALDAGADLLLLSFDGQQYYRAMDCALDALRGGRLDRAVLVRSRGRLEANASRSADLLAPAADRVVEEIGGRLLPAP